jgi:hypothetical protein
MIIPQPYVWFSSHIHIRDYLNNNIRANDPQCTSLSDSVHTARPVSWTKSKIPVTFACESAGIAYQVRTYIVKLQLPLRHSSSSYKYSILSYNLSPMNTSLALRISVILTPI